MSRVRQEEPVCGAADSGGSSRGGRNVLPALGVPGLPLVRYLEIKLESLLVDKNAELKRAYREHANTRSSTSMLYCAGAIQTHS
jgi:hypothetical protein